MSDNLVYFGASATGRRSNNEDNYLCLQPDDDTYCFAVADGMGGAKYGEIASSIVIEDVELFLLDAFHNHKRHLQLKQVLADCFSYIQHRFAEYLDEHPDHRGMGTTLALLLVHKNRYAWGNIGDSRIYRFSDNRLDQISTDHTLLQQMRNEGKTIDRTTASNYSHLLTKCINGGNEKPAIFPDGSDHKVMEANTSFILCSDGLIMENEDDDFSNTLTSISSKIPAVKNRVQQLIDYAFNAGSMDNITVIALQWGSRTERRRPGKYTLVLLSLAFLITVIGLFFYTIGVTDLFSLHEKKNAVQPEGILTDSTGWIDNPLPDTAIRDTSSFTADSLKNPLDWIPLDTAEHHVRKPTSFIVWQDYPIRDHLKYYRVTVKNMSEKDVQVKNVPRNRNNLALKVLKKIRYPDSCYISVDAVLRNDSVRAGNTLMIRTIPE